MKYLITFILFLSLALSYAQGPGNPTVTKKPKPPTFDARGGAFSVYFVPVSNLMLSIGAIVGLLAAIKVYNRWHIGEDDLFEGVSNLFLGAIFLITITIALRVFFSLN